MTKPGSETQLSPEELAEQKAREAEEKKQQEEEEKKRQEELENGGEEIIIGDDGEPLTKEQLEARKKEEEVAKQKEIEERRRQNEQNAKRRLDQEKAQLKRENEELRNRIGAIESKVSTERLGFPDNRPTTRKDRAYWEERLEKDPFGAMVEYEEHKWNERMRNARSEEMNVKQTEDMQKVLAESAEFVYEAHPELRDETSEKSLVFLDVLAKHPDWRNSPVGPILTMREMEKMLKQRGTDGGNQTDDAVRRAREEGAREEALRRDRTNASPPGGGRQLNKTKTIVLTREQLEYCKERGIKPEDYARTAARLAGEGKVEL